MKPIFSAVFILALFLSACSPTTLQARLDRIAAVAQAANVAIQIAPVPPEVKTWVDAVNTAAQKSVAEMKINQPDTVRYANISAYWTPVTSMAITTAGLDPKIAIAIVATQVAVQIFLTELARSTPSGPQMDAALDDVERNVKVISKAAR